MAKLVYCESLEDIEEDVDDALDDVDDAMPDAIDPWDGEVADDCTSMIRLGYTSFIINKIQLEDCLNASGVYYD